MRTCKLYLAGSMLALLLTPAIALAQSEVPSPEATPDVQIEVPKVEQPSASTSAVAASDSTAMFVDALPTGDWLVSQWTGKSVMNAADENVGDINDVLIDRNGNVTAVVVGVGGFLGLGEKNVAIAFNALKFEEGGADGRIVRVAMSKTELENAPQFVGRTAADADKKPDEVPTKVDEPLIKPVVPLQ